MTIKAQHKVNAALDLWQNVIGRAIIQKTGHGRGRQVVSEEELCEHFTAYTKMLHAECKTRTAKRFHKMLDTRRGKRIAPPLDAVDDLCKVGIEFKTCHHAFTALDIGECLGAFIPEHKWFAMQIMCQCPHLPGKRINPPLGTAWFVYCDENRDVFRLKLNEIQRLIYDGLVRYKTLRGTNGLSVPTKFWEYTGSVGKPALSYADILSIREEKGCELLGDPS